MYFISVTIQPRLSCFEDMNVQKPTYIENQPTLNLVDENLDQMPKIVT